ncbi:hypothetical protein [Granulicella mallensis]|uniref:Uncharacterized protein n=1 Tax=Granulicella mallensis TaxID=940614 RepID=A0A7W7ZPP0_9BACT|nr:hypothetical protein [Granulicella mallensis]MBB5063876.1 hypothetical protein [Granulicella mallensis]
MQTDVKQVFYFHADANSLGGFLEEPFRYIPTPCSVALSSTGGSVTQKAEPFHFEDRIHAKASYTHVSGRPAKRNGPWTQRVSSVVEGFNLLGRVTADSLAAQVFIEHPEAGGGPRKISFAGSHIRNLRVDGRPVTPVLNATLLPEQHRSEDVYNRDASVNPELAWPTLWQAAHRQGVDLLENRSIPEWVRARYGWIAAKENSGEGSLEGYTLCSLVDKLDGLTADRSSGHSIDVPDLGRIFLGEVTIFPQAVTLTMLRAELGCALTGQASAASVASNGTMQPPNILLPGS